jgi:hypothetical protein
MKNLLLFLLALFVINCSTSPSREDKLPKDAVVSKSGQIFRTGLIVPMNFKPLRIVKAHLGEDLPATFDWRDKVTLSPIENQGSCGSCWAFSTAATFQDVKRIFGETEDLSEQYLLSCANPSQWSCNGGFFAHDAHKSPRGGVLASEYPYTAKDTTCKSSINYRWKLSSWAYLQGGENPTVDEIKAAIYKYGPVSVGVAVDDSFSSYTGGIFQGTGFTNLNHAVNIVGWGDGYWIMRNSWGTSWGENGYMRLKFGANGIGAWANFIIYNKSPDPGPSPDPQPTPDPTPTPDPEPDCTPKPIADTGYGDSIKVRAGSTIILGSREKAGHTYYWTAEPSFDNNARPETPKIKYKPRITKRLTVHAVTICGEATDSVTVNVRGISTEKEDLKSAP